MIQYAYDRNSERTVHISEVSKATKHNYNLECLLCEEDIIVKDGEIKIKHFSHKGINHGSRCTTETVHHKAAKFLLAAFINDKNNSVNIISCKCNPPISITNCQAIVEYTVANGKADIALCRKEELVCLFEIKYTHPTEFRHEKWFEFTASEVLKQLELDENNIMLRDIRPCICVSQSKKEVSVTREAFTKEDVSKEIKSESVALTSENTIQTHFKSQVTLSFDQEIQAEIDNIQRQLKGLPKVLTRQEMENWVKQQANKKEEQNPNGRKQRSNYLRKSSTHYERPEFLRRKEEKTMDVAEKLGYCGEFDDWRSFGDRVALLCRIKKICFIRKGWIAFTHINFSDWNKAYSQFRKDNKCLKCKTECELTFLHVYCDTCYEEIKANRHCEVEEKTYDVTSLNTIRSYFQFISEIPNSEWATCICFKCEQRNFSVWFYNYKCVCINCLVQIHNGKYPKGKYFDINENNLDVIVKSYTDNYHPY